MATKFELSAETRADQGKGASRRLRHAGKVPGIIYGGNETPANISLSHQKLEQVVDNEKFYATIVTVDVAGAKQQVVVKDVQMHPARNAIVHIDFQRVLADKPIRMHVPIHFLNEATSPGVKLQGGVVSHTRSDVEVSCLPKDLPEFIEVDMGQMKLNDSVKLSDLKLPAGVSIQELVHGHDGPVVAIHAPRVEAEEAPAAADAAAVPAAKGAAPAKAAAPAKK
ncbi:MAG: hypothetical protein RLZZ200_2787 [Pseudomonadota bacterium]|jgi:large subunit ribosomal protein L25